ncbi:hypothetical protein CRUP_028551, partial [Coryphaenoides rupestris]
PLASPLPGVHSSTLKTLYRAEGPHLSTVGL